MQTILTQLDANASLRSATHSLNNQQIRDQCQVYAAKLQAHNIKVLALCCDNSIDWVLLDLACQLAGICIIPLPTFFSQQQLSHIVQSNNIDAIVCERKDFFMTLLSSLALPATSQPQAYGALSIITLDKNHKQPNSQRYPKNTGKVTFTSGSTGRPKGVCLSHDQLIQQAKALNQRTGLGQHRHLCVLPLSTLLENVAGVYTTLLAGGELIVPSLQDLGFTGSCAINIKSLCSLITKHQVHSLIVTPQLLQCLLLAAESDWQPPGSLKFVAVGGAKMAQQLLDKAIALDIPVYEGYGLSECASVVSLNTPQQHQPTTVGQPLAQLQLNIEQDELVVTGNCMLGYANEPASWYPQKIATGDLASIDTQGYLQIKGRKKNLLISSYGRNISPEWLESELLANPDIDECVVFGDAQPYCVALISPRLSTISTALIQQYIDRLNKQLPDYARLRDWRLLPQPLRHTPNLMTANGRPKRDAIGQYYAELIASLYPSVVEESVL
ncbi:AMP-binding protein [Dasania sp. GY-MA-18]|uniref:AMP-binding protein n=1 Tax=Dasania phycosphaerae TaxID=2950436 RepID=A0A9J6RN60_9GAMM|nr:MULTISPECIES: AMP-binding protein [Dasania]MCR8923006.1 AMP-binding protein [Dasania sp. GY-MA-18]MCZ0865437.1 AMP-binding protein [Dasania phycosphaerae]MCZ0869162.1 AMP-binding protein [Dasania phycosphaerae]